MFYRFSLLKNMFFLVFNWRYVTWLNFLWYFFFVENFTHPTSRPPNIKTSTHVHSKNNRKHGLLEWVYTTCVPLHCASSSVRIGPMTFCQSTFRGDESCLEWLETYIGKVLRRDTCKLDAKWLVGRWAGQRAHTQWERLERCHEVRKGWAEYSWASYDEEFCFD